MDTSHGPMVRLVDLDFIFPKTGSWICVFESNLVSPAFHGVFCTVDEVEAFFYYILDVLIRNDMI